MSVDSPATIISFERFLECRERRRIAAGTNPVLIPAPTDPDTPPEAIGRANAEQSEPPQYVADRLVDA